MNPRQAAARVLMGRVHLMQKDFRLAQDQFEAAVLLDPGQETRFNIARAWLDAGQTYRGIFQLQQSAKLQPNDAEVYELLAQAYTRVGQKAEARQASRKAALLRSKADSSRAKASAN